MTNALGSSHKWNLDWHYSPPLSNGFSTPWIKSEPIHLRGTQTKKIFTTLEIPPFHYYGRLRPGLFLNMYFFSTSAIGRQDIRKRLDRFNDFHKGMTDTLHKSYSSSSLSSSYSSSSSQETTHDPVWWFTRRFLGNTWWECLSQLNRC